MDKMSDNALKRARKIKGYTQEKAAEMSGYSPDAIQLWESGRRRPSLEALEALAAIYEAKWMPTLYILELSSGALSETLPKFRPGVPLPQAVLTLLDRVMQFSDNHPRRIVAMAADGQIDDTERQEFETIMDDLQAICEAAMELKFSEGGRGHSGP